MTMKDQASVITQLYILCPFCEKDTNRIDHLDIGRSFGPWYCDTCDHCYRGVRTETGATLEKLDKTRKVVPVLLQYIHDPRLRLIVDASEYSEFTDSDHAYFYNEHTCPTNFLSRVRMVIAGDDHGDDKDPHGVFEFVRRATTEDLDETT
jgi:hypothetical protein